MDCGADNDAHELETGGAAGGAIAGVTGDVVACAGVAIAADRCRSERQRESGGEIARTGRSGLGATLGVEMNMIGLAGLEAFEARVHLLGDSVGGNEFMKDDAELAVARQAPCGLHLEDGTLQAAALRKKEAVAVEQRLREDRID